MIPFVSVVVPCRNEKDQVSSFLDSLIRQEDPGTGWEVIVADGMSDDGTREILREYAERWPRLRLIENPAGIVSTGLNAAIRASRGGVIIRMDVHTSYAPDYIRQCVAVLEETGADNVGGPQRASWNGTRSALFSAAHHSAFATGGGKSHDAAYCGPVDTVYLGCWRRQTLERIGLFDETLVRNQDDELNLRLIRSGGKIWQSPRIRCWYQPRTSFRRLFRQQFQYGFWKVAVVRKHRLPASWRHLVPGGFVLANVALPATAAAAAIFSPPAGTLLFRMWLALAAIYAAASFIASFRVSKRHGWALLPLLPAVFLSYHVAYGLGFVAGAAHFYLRDSLSAPKLFTELSR